MIRLLLFFLTLRRPPIATRTDTPCPSTTHFRSDASSRLVTVGEAAAIGRITAANTPKLRSRHHDKVQTEKSGKRVMLTPEQVRQLCGLVQSHTRSTVPQRAEGQAPFVLTTSNLKGGSSKTTLTIQDRKSTRLNSSH